MGITGDVSQIANIGVFGSAMAPYFNNIYLAKSGNTVGVQAI
jgi:hypothetical protein